MNRNFRRINISIEKVKEYFKSVGINSRIKEFDESLKQFETVFPACGSSNSAIELTISELERYSGFIAWVDVCKPKNS